MYINFIGTEFDMGGSNDSNWEKGKACTSVHTRPFMYEYLSTCIGLNLNSSREVRDNVYMMELGETESSKRSVAGADSESDCG